MAVVYEELADELVRQDVRAIFGLLGEDTLRLAVELEQRGIRYYGARHESAAVGMADGYARTSGELGVALISRGPGLTNALTGIVTSARSKSPVLVLAADSSDSDEAFALKHVDQDMLIRSTGVLSALLEAPATVARDVGELCLRARKGATIVANVRRDVLEAIVDSSGSETGEVSGRGETPPATEISGPTADPEQISFVADLLQESWAFKRPVILAGRGAVTSSARPELERLGELCGALLATTVMAKALFSGHPYDIGVAGSFATQVTVELLAEADVVLVFGASLDAMTTLHGSLFRKARVIRFDQDPTAEERGSTPSDVFMTADAKSGARALADELENRGHRVQGYRENEVAARIAAFRLYDDVTDRGTEGALDPRLLFLRLDEVLPQNRTLVFDNGHHRNFGAVYLSATDPLGFILPLEFRSVGAGMGVALGAAIGDPSRLTVYETGDAGLMMALGDLETAVRYNLRLLVLVANDSALGAEVHFLRAFGLPDEIAKCPTPDFAALARGLGADGIAINSLDDVEQVRARIDPLERPLILDCRISLDMLSDSQLYGMKL